VSNNPIIEHPCPVIRRQVIVASSITNYSQVALGGQVVACLPLDPSFIGAKLPEDNGFLRMMIICNTASFRGEVKPSVPCHKILRHIKESYKYQKDTL
jgi:hypothetical protein